MINESETLKQPQPWVGEICTVPLASFLLSFYFCLLPRAQGVAECRAFWRLGVGGRALSALPIRLPSHQKGRPPSRTMWPFNPLSVRHDLWKQEVSPFKEPASSTTTTTTSGLSSTARCSRSVSPDGPDPSALTGPLAEHLRGGREGCANSVLHQNDGVPTQAKSWLRDTHCGVVRSITATTKILTEHSHVHLFLASTYSSLREGNQRCLGIWLIQYIYCTRLILLLCYVETTVHLPLLLALLTIGLIHLSPDPVHRNLYIYKVYVDIFIHAHTQNLYSIFYLYHSLGV